MWLQDFSAAIRTISGHRRAGMKRRARQVLTVDKGRSRAAATAPVPPKSSMAVSTVTDMDANIVRGLRTSQVFAHCEPTFPPKDDEIGSMIGTSWRDKERAQATRWLLDFELQSDFVRKAKIAKTSWSEIESGKKTITLGMARKIKKQFNMSLDWTLDGDVSALSIKHQKKLRGFQPMAA
jgi:DNA-binding XRE family transcriptional regulator